MVWRQRGVSVAVGRVLVLVGALAIVSPAWAATDLHVEPACDGLGFSGWIQQDDVLVYFESCETAMGGHSIIWSDSNPRMTEVLVVGDELTYWVDQLEIADSNTQEELEVSGQVFATAEADLVAHYLWPKLMSTGRAPRSTSMRMLAANLTGYEHVPQSTPGEGDCYGCCGYGCSGCTGCYTQLCRQHDECVRENGGGIWAHVKCSYLLPAAAFSA